MDIIIFHVCERVVKISVKRPQISLLKDVVTQIFVIFMTRAFLLNLLKLRCENESEEDVY